MRKVHGRLIGLPPLGVDSLPRPLSMVHSWYRRRFCLQDRLEYMAVLRVGIVPRCSHSQLRTGLLDGASFKFGFGDDIGCTDCGQVWVATEDSDHYSQYGSSASWSENNQ